MRAIRAIGSAGTYLSGAEAELRDMALASELAAYPT